MNCELAVSLQKGPCASGDLCICSNRPTRSNHICPDCGNMVHAACASEDEEAVSEADRAVCKPCSKKRKAEKSSKGDDQEEGLAAKKSSSTRARNLKPPPPSGRPRIVIDGLIITDPHASMIGKCRAPDSRKKSLAWECFHICQYKGKEGACCNLCGVALATHGNTSSMTRHLRDSHSNIWNKLNDLKEGRERETEKPAAAATGRQTSKLAVQSMLPFKSTSAAPIKKNRHEKEEAALDAAAIYAASCNRPFSDFNEKPYQRMMDTAVESAAAGGKSCFCGFTVKNRVQDLARQGRQKMTTGLEPKADLSFQTAE